MKHIWIALGSNQNDPAQQLQRARQELAQLFHEEKASHIYRTPPWGYLAQPDFLNAVIRYRTDKNAHQVLRDLQDIEQKHHRIRQQKNGPRTLDLDLLLYEGVVLEEPDLIVPHPRMHQRAFVLEPLAELDSEMQLAEKGSICDLLAQCDCSGQTRLNMSGWSVS